MAGQRCSLDELKMATGTVIETHKKAIGLSVALTSNETIHVDGATKNDSSVWETEIELRGLVID